MENFPLDNLTEVFSYFNLSDLSKLSNISKSFQQAAEQRKQYIYNHLLRPETQVQIKGLQSEKGKVHNGRIGTIKGKPNSDNDRFPIQILYLTGETELLAVKATNLNPFLTPDQLEQEKKRYKAISYSQDGRVRESHGMLLDQIFMLARWSYNEMTGQTYFRNMDFSQYMNLSRADPRVGGPNAALFSFYKVKPSLAGYSVPHDETIFDSVVKSLVQNQNQIVQAVGKKTKWPADGPNGHFLIRNMVRFMSTWDAEVIIGKFWIVKTTKTGTILVSENSDDDESLGKVYLVKGLASNIGDLFLGRFGDGTTPIQGVLTVVPVYNFLVYDGIALGPNKRASPSKKKQILKHVEDAVKSDSIVYQGTSASLGNWDDEPPVLPCIRGDDSLDWGKCNDHVEESLSHCNPGENLTCANFVVDEEHKRIAKEIAKLAKKVGVQNIKKKGFSITIRRFGYTRDENPNLMCAMILGSTPVHMFTFSEWPSYNLDEILKELVICFKDIKKVPSMIMVDELSLVEPMKMLFDEAFITVGMKESSTCPTVMWYPPPSAMEQTFNQMNAGNGPPPFN